MGLGVIEQEMFKTRFVYISLFLNNFTMPRVQKKGEQSSEARQLAIQAAVAAVNGGESSRSAAKRFGIPRTTLQEHCSKPTLYT